MRKRFDLLFLNHKSGFLCVCHRVVAFSFHTDDVPQGECAMTTILFDMTSLFCQRLSGVLKFCISILGDVAVDVVNSDRVD